MGERSLLFLLMVEAEKDEATQDSSLDQTRSLKPLILTAIDPRWFKQLR